jgi:hypothetical protein
MVFVLVLKWITRSILLRMIMAANDLDIQICTEKEVNMVEVLTRTLQDVEEELILLI